MTWSYTLSFDLWNHDGQCYGDCRLLSWWYDLGSYRFKFHTHRWSFMISLAKVR